MNIFSLFVFYNIVMGPPFFFAPGPPKLWYGPEQERGWQSQEKKVRIKTLEIDKTVV